MDPDIAYAGLLNAVQRQDEKAFWIALDDLHQARAKIGRLPKDIVPTPG